MHDYVSFNCVHVAKAMNDEPAVAYADIDGHPLNHNEPGSVVCRVWLLEQGIDDTKHRKFLVDWHHNGYRENKLVLELIDKAKKMLMEYEDSLVDDVFHKAYERFKLKWMLEHNCTLKDLIKELEEQMHPKGGIGAETVVEAFNQFEEDSGFSGMLWPSKAEFRDTEAQDDELMLELLSGYENVIWKNRSKDWR